jgi:uncharacterized protein (TIGR02996 family)
MNFKAWMNESSDPNFMQPLESNPKDMPTWLVYADWLEEQGDERHELIRGLVVFKKIEEKTMQLSPR